MELKFRSARAKAKLRTGQWAGPPQESIAHISEQARQFNAVERALTSVLWVKWRPRRGSGPGYRDPGAVPPAHQDAILGLAEVGDRDREPDAGPDQQRRDGQRRGIRQHAVPEVVGLVQRFAGRRQIT